MSASLRWMISVALVASALAPVVAAQVPDLGLSLGDLSVQSPAAGLGVDTPAIPDPAAIQALMDHWRHTHGQGGGGQESSQASDSSQDPGPQPQGGTTDDGDGPLGAAQGVRDRAVSEAQNAQATADAQAQSAHDQADHQVKTVGDAASNTTGLLPADPVGYTVGAAERTANEAAGVVPVQTNSMAPQSGGSQAAEPALIPPILAGGLLVVGAAGATFFAFWLAGSSGTVVSGAAAAKSTELRRLLPFASPLFTRFEKETVLGHPRREALYALILQQPGVSLQSLGEATGLSRTAVLHHLRLLEMQHLVVSKRLGRSRHYYENGGRYGRDAKEAYAILQNQRSKEVAQFIRTHPGAMQKELCEALQIQPSIAHWHVRRLQGAQLVEAVRQGRAVNYFPAPALLEVAAQPELPALPTLPEAMPAAQAPLAMGAGMLSA